MNKLIHTGSNKADTQTHKTHAYPTFPILGRCQKNMLKLNNLKHILTMLHIYRWYVFQKALDKFDIRAQKFIHIFNILEAW